MAACSRDDHGAIVHLGAKQIITPKRFRSASPFGSNVPLDWKKALDGIAGGLAHCSPARRIEKPGGLFVRRIILVCCNCGTLARGARPLAGAN
jgi:hypothetical protein